MLAILDDISRHLPASGGHSQVGDQYQWYQLRAEQLHDPMSFWDARDIQRISQQLRDVGLILLRSAPFTQSQTIEFAFNQGRIKPDSHGPQSHAPQSHTLQSHTLQNKAVTLTPAGQAPGTGPGAAPISPYWQPDGDTLTAIAQLNIPEHFAREQVPEFVRYWRENGRIQHSWSSKFIQYVKRQWAFHVTRMVHRGQASVLPRDWQPSQGLQAQIANEGIPVAFAEKELSYFRLYHQKSGTTYVDWDLPFFSWVKEEWRKRDTPYIETRRSTPMHPQWQPDQHTIDYLTGISCNIDKHFVQECIPEFIHKWTEKNAFFSEWGNIFARHVSEQWQFVVAGIKRNPERKLISRQWRPSADCLDILQIQSGINREFIAENIAEFILYWTNRAEPMHSWDNIFLRHIKQRWAEAHKGRNSERHQHTNQPRSTRDISLEERLTDRSWAS